MKTAIFTAFAMLATTTAQATTYQGTFQSVWTTSAFEDKPVTATVTATSDGVNFEIDSLAISFTDTLLGEGGWVGSSLDPIAVSIDIFSAGQPLDFIPNSDIASIIPLSLSWDIQYTGIYKQGISFEVFNTDSQLPFGFRELDTIFDFGTPGEIAMTFSTTPATLGLPSIHVTGVTFGSALEIPIEPVVLKVIPEPSTLMLVGFGLMTIALRRKRIAD